MMIRDAAAIAIPTIVTERLLLVPPGVEDFEGYASIVTTDRGRFIDGPLEHVAAWLDFSQMVAGWVLRGYGALTIRPKDGDAYLGTVLVHHEYGDPEPELGCLLTEAAEGKGIALEAGRAMREWAFAHTEVETLVSHIDTANARATLAAQRLGGRLVEGVTGVVTYRYDRASSDATSSI